MSTDKPDAPAQVPIATRLVMLDVANPAPTVQHIMALGLGPLTTVLACYDDAGKARILFEVVLPLLAGFMRGQIGADAAAQLCEGLPEFVREAEAELQAQNMRMN